MKLSLKYRFLLVSICFALLVALPKFYHIFSNLVFVIEEFFAVVMFAIGFLVFQPIIKVLLAKKYKRLKRPFNSKHHIAYILIIVLLFSFIVGLILFCFVWIYQNQYGVPEFYQIKENLLSLKKEEYIIQNKHIPPWYNIHPFSAVMYLPPFIGGSLLLFSSLFALEEYFRYNNYLRRKELKKEQNAKELAMSKIYSIQQQLNPHFMFNTLNVLAGLMHEDLNKADVFIKKLSEIYRYVLLQSEEIVSTLEKEIEFIRAYIYLLKIRFEGKLFVDIDVDKDKLDHLIPSMTLELLVENAVKHNRLEIDKPLNIMIYIEEECLVVKNIILPRINKTSSLGIGIKNLQKRLSALGINSASFVFDEDFFFARIPLIKSVK